MDMAMQEHEEIAAIDRLEQHQHVQASHRVSAMERAVVLRATDANAKLEGVVPIGNQSMPSRKKLVLVGQQGGHLSAWKRSSLWEELSLTGLKACCCGSDGHGRPG